MKMPKPFEEVSYLYKHSASTRRPLRIGLLFAGSPQVNCAAVNVIRDISKSDFARLELIVVNGTCYEPARMHCVGDERGEPPKQSRSALLWRLYRRFYRPVRGAEIDPAATINCESMLSNVDRLKIETEVSGIEKYSAEDVAALYAKDLDVLLHFGLTTKYGAISGSPGSAYGRFITRIMTTTAKDRRISGSCMSETYFPV